MVCTFNVYSLAYVICMMLQQTQTLTLYVCDCGFQRDQNEVLSKPISSHLSIDTDSHFEVSG